MDDDYVRSRIDEIATTLARIVPPVVSVTVGQLWPAYELAERTRLKSWRDHAQRWRDHVGPYFWARQAPGITPGDVDAYRSARLRAGAAMATVNREIALLRRVLRWSARRGHLASSPLHGSGMTAELIHRERNTRTTIVQERPGSHITLADFLASAEPRLRTFVLLLHHTGMRRGEAARLRWDRIDIDLGLAWLPAAETKGEHGGRDVPLSAEVLAALKGVPRTSAWLWPSRRADGPEHPDTWTHRFGRLVRRLALTGPDGPPWLHDLRRSFITLSRRRGESETSIMEVSGHRTREAFRRYDVHDRSDVIRFRARMAAARLEELAAAGRKPPHRAGAAAGDEPAEASA